MWNLKILALLQGSTLVKTNQNCNLKQKLSVDGQIDGQMDEQQKISDIVAPLINLGEQSKTSLAYMFLNTAY